MKRVLQWYGLSLNLIKMVSISTSNWTKMYMKDKGSRVQPPQIGIYSKSGSGKSMAEEGIVSAYHKLGYVIIYLSDNKSEEEPAYCQFPVQERYHKELLRKEGRPERTVDCRIYHPFSFSLPTTLMPEYNFFTLPIRSLGRSEFSMLSESKEDSDTIRILMQASSNLSKEGGIYQLLHDVQGLIKGRKGMDNKPPPSSKGFYLSVSSGTAKDMTSIANLFNPFKHDYWLSRETHPLNLNFKEIVSNNRPIHYFSTKFLKDDKMKEFMILTILNKIIEYKDYAKHPIMIVIPEVRRLTPSRPEGYKKFLSDGIKDALSTMRSQGSGMGSILTSQVWTDTSQQVRSSHTITLLGELALDDIGKISKIKSYGRFIKDKLSGGYEYAWLWVGKENYDFWHFWTPPFCHAETHYKYHNMFKRFFPERMRRYTDVIELMRKQFNEEEEKFRLKAEREAEQEKKRLQEKRAKKTGESVLELRKKKSESKKQDKLKLQELAYNMRKEGMTLKDIGRKLGTSKDSISRWLNNYEIPREPIENL